MSLFELLPRQVFWYFCNFLEFKDLLKFRCADKYMADNVKIKSLTIRYRRNNRTIDISRFKFIEYLTVSGCIDLDLSQFKYLRDIKLYGCICTQFPISVEALKISFSGMVDNKYDLSSLTNLYSLSLQCVYMKNVILSTAIRRFEESSCKIDNSDVARLENLDYLKFTSETLTVFPPNLTYLVIYCLRDTFDISYLDKLKRVIISQYKKIKFPDNLESINILTTSKTVDLSEMKNLKAVHVYRNLVKLPPYEVKNITTIYSI